MPLNIMHVISSLGCGGLEKIAIELCAVFTKRGYHMSICCLDRLGELAPEAKARGIEVHHVKRRKGFDLTLPFRLARFMRKEGVDIVHTHNMGPLLYGTIAARLSGVRVVVNTRHGRAMQTASPFIWGLNDSVIFISEDSRREMLKYNRIKGQSAKIVYNGIDTGLYRVRANKDTARDRLRIARGARVIGTVGRLSEEKDQRTLIDAFAKVVELHDDARLLIVGDGGLRKELERYAGERGVHGKAIFMGFRDDITDILPAMDVFVLSSTMEGVALTLLESMAAGKPVVATNVGGNPEVVLDGITGFLVPPKDPAGMAEAIERILSDGQMSEMMGEAGRARVNEKFSLDNMTAGYMRVYESCLAKRRRAV